MGDFLSSFAMTYAALFPIANILMAKNTAFS